MSFTGAEAISRDELVVPGARNIQEPTPNPPATMTWTPEVVIRPPRTKAG